MRALMRKITTWSLLLQKRSCQFSVGNSQALPAHADHGLLQATRGERNNKTLKELAMRLHATHMKLKFALDRGEDFNEVWSKHSSDTSDLSGYAAAMHDMGLQWERVFSPLKDRNTWIEAHVRHYYYKRHNLVALQEEVCRAMLDPTLLTPSQQETIRDMQPTLAAFWKQQMLEDRHDPRIGSEDHARSEEVAEDGLPGSRRRGAAEPAKVLSSDTSLPEALVYGEDGCDTGQLCATRRVRVLDVGSCYNPLARYPHLLITPLDLMPASQDVYKCDFLDVKVADASECRDLLHAGDEGARADRQIERLPRNYYDVVVFSLMLDYIPCPEARLLCCRKAHQLLKPGGLLLIVTPLGTGTIGTLFFKWMQLHMSRLGFSRLQYSKKAKNRVFSYRKGFFPLLWSTTEAEEIEGDIVNMQSSLRAVEHKEVYDKIDLDKGIYFTRDCKLF